MNWGAFILLAVLLTVLLLAVQRTEAKRRRLTRIMAAVLGFLTWYWASVRGLTSEFVLAILLAVVVNLLFWLSIGRYNPVPDSDDTIKVYGLDDDPD